MAALILPRDNDSWNSANEGFLLGLTTALDRVRLVAVVDGCVSEDVVVPATLLASVVTVEGAAIPLGATVGGSCLGTAYWLGNAGIQ